MVMGIAARSACILFILLSLAGCSTAQKWGYAVSNWGNRLTSNVHRWLEDDHHWAMAYDEDRYVPFTQQLRDLYQLSPQELGRLEYYLARPVMLRREASTAGERRVEHGRLIADNGKLIQEVFIRRNIPGLAVKIGQDWIDVSFEADTSLRFGSDPETRNVWAGKYALYAQSWHQDVGELVFEGRSYNAIGDSGKTYLLIDQQSLNDVRKRTRILSGRSLHTAD